MKIATSFLNIQDSKQKIEKLNSIADYMHYDIMDGKFTENATLDFQTIKNNTTNITKPKDIHLMVIDIKHYIDMYSTINPNIITFHLEATKKPLEIINYIKNKNIKVGISINPDTDVKQLEPYLNKIDLVLIMTVKAGKGGQKFIDVTNKIDYLHSYRQSHNLNFLIEADGGINEETITKVKKADIAVIGSYITNSENYEMQVSKLRRFI